MVCKVNLKKKAEFKNLDIFIARLILTLRDFATLTILAVAPLQVKGSDYH